MNLRSVFTAEQQRILEHYYENGMTNQSKSCFQLILQCAQDTKLDFSVVRTWVGNKRRKLASKADQNGISVFPTSLSNHRALPAASGALVTESVSPGDMAATQNNCQGLSVTQYLSPQASCSSSPSSPLSSSPLSTGSGPHSDVILTSIYSLTRNANGFDASTFNKTGMQTLPLHSEIHLPTHNSTALQIDRAVHPSAIATMQRKAPIMPSSTTLKSNRLLKQFNPTDSEFWNVGISANWAQQQKTLQTPTWCNSSPSKTAVVHCSSPQITVDNSPQIQKVFTLAGLRKVSQLPHTKNKETTKKQVVNMSEISIAMETGNAEDEYLREEELANMGAQMQSSKGSSDHFEDGGHCSSVCVSSLIDSPGVSKRSQSATTVNSSNSAHFGEKACQTSSSLDDTCSHGSISLRQPSQPSSRMPDFKVMGNSSASWLYSNCRKRTLQDRTQFSDRDLYALKRYWDNGMTSLGLVCKEKISAAASELNVDTEIIKTWIGNRRRKYRLMGIEIPPPKGGPAVFSSTSEAISSQILEDEHGVPELAEGCEHNDIVSPCLSDDGASDFSEKMNDYVSDGSDKFTSAKNVKIEIIDEEDDGDAVTTEIEHMQNFLEFKNEEVQFLEEELQNQKQKFLKLKNFTRSLLIAVKNNDHGKQQELLASLPQKMNEDWSLGLDNHTESGIEATSIQTDSSISVEMDTEAVKL